MSELKNDLDSLDPEDLQYLVGTAPESVKPSELGGLDQEDVLYLANGKAVDVTDHDTRNALQKIYGRAKEFIFGTDVKGDYARKDASTAQLVGDFTTLSVQEAGPGMAHGLVGMGGLLGQYGHDKSFGSMGQQGQEVLESIAPTALVENVEYIHYLETYMNIRNDLLDVSVELAGRMPSTETDPEPEGPWGQIPEHHGEQDEDANVAALLSVNAAANAVNPGKIMDVLGMVFGVPVNLLIAGGLVGGARGYSAGTRIFGSARQGYRNLITIGRIRTPDIDPNTVVRAAKAATEDVSARGAREGVDPEAAARIAAIQAGEPELVGVGDAAVELGDNVSRRKRPLLLFANDDSEYADAVRATLTRARREEKATRMMSETPEHMRTDVAMPDDFFAYADRKARQFLYAQHLSAQASEDLGRVIVREVPNSDIRRDMLGLLEGTGTFEYGTKEAADNLSQLRARLNKLPVEQRKKVYELVDQISARRKQLFAEMNAFRGTIGEEELTPITAWMHHSWEVPKRPTALQAKFLEDFQNPNLSKIALEEKQTISSYQRGLELGLKPKTRDIADLLYSIDRQHSELVARKKLISSLINFGESADGLPIFVRGTEMMGQAEKALGASGQYVKFDLEFANKILPEVLDEVKEAATKGAVAKYGAGLPQGQLDALTKKAIKDGGLDQVWVHKDVAESIRRVLQPKSFIRGPKVNPTILDDFMKVYWNLAMLEKRAVFGFTMFHMMPLAENVLAMAGPVRGPGIIMDTVRAGGGIPMPYEAAKRWDNFAGGSERMQQRIMRAREGAPGQATEDLRHALVSGTPLEEAMHLTSYLGLKVGHPRADIAIRQVDEIVNAGMKRITEIAERGGPNAGRMGHAAEKVVETAQHLQRMFDAGLWDRFHTPIKVAMGDMLYHNMLGLKYGHLKNVPATDRMLAKIMGMGVKLQDMTDEQIGIQVMRFINDEMGGQNWALHTRNSFMRLLSDERALEILSSTFLSPDWNTSALRAASAFASDDPVRKLLGVKHWVYSGISYYVYANALNRLFTGGLADGNDIWENPPGKNVHHIRLPFKGEDEKELYINLYKQFREGPNALVKGKQFLQSKARPLIKLAFSQETDPAGFPTHMGKLAVEAMAEGRETMYWEDALAFNMDVLSQFVPFGTRGAISAAGKGEGVLQKGTLALLSQWFPISTGLTMQDAKPKMAEALRDNHDTEEVTRLGASLLANGYPMDKVQAAVKWAKDKAAKHP